jgi:cleavage and polyadenylation specificity factor subunit 1
MLHDQMHPGVKATRKLIQDHYVWPNMAKEIAGLVKSCTACGLSKIHRHHKSQLQPYPAPDGRFTDLNIDIVGPLPPCQGYNYLFTIIDRFTKWPAAIPMKDMTTESCVKALLHGWISIFGVPVRLTSDQGRQFESSMWHILMQILGVDRIRTTSYHPQANGAIERFHRTLKASLMATLQDDNWVDKLPMILLGLRNSVKEDTGHAPAVMVFGTQTRLPGCYLEDSTVLEAGEFLKQLQLFVSTLRPPKTTWHCTENPQITPGLMQASHVFVLDSTIRPR